MLYQVSHVGLAFLKKKVKVTSTFTEEVKVEKFFLFCKLRPAKGTSVCYSTILYYYHIILIMFILYYHDYHVFLYDIDILYHTLYKTYEII